MDTIEIGQLNILDRESVQEYSDLIMEVMDEFNKEEKSEFQKWVVGVEAIIDRKEFDKKHGSLTSGLCNSSPSPDCFM
jgi:hypothetical protein